ncbi:MAG: DUF4097 family beta strand repeat protein [Lachnospiraceae bacterium]|nr:DUF4097 family beta strand repeat protein [Lachnospiraceae bacterium]
MKKVWIIIAVILLTLGIALFAGAFIASGFDLSKLTPMQYETNTHKVKDSFERFDIDVKTADVFLKPSTDGLVKVVCEEAGKVRHQVYVENGTLYIRVQDEREWFDYLSLFSKPTSVTIYLPMELPGGKLLVNSKTGDVSVTAPSSFGTVEVKTNTGDVSFTGTVKGVLNLTTDTGDIELNDVRAGGAILIVGTGRITASSVVCKQFFGAETGTGRITIRDLTCENFYTTGGTGDLKLTNVIASAGFKIERGTGEIEFNQCDASTVQVRTSTGDVTGSFLTAKLFSVKTSTGKVRVPETHSGGTCEITTGTGNILIGVGLRDGVEPGQYVPVEEEVKTPARLAITTPAEKTHYFIGERPNLAGLEVVVLFEDESAQKIWSYSCQWTPERFEEAGEQFVTLSYAGLEVRYPVTVTEPVVDRIYVNTDPQKTVYHVGESLDPEGLTVYAHYDDGTAVTFTDGFTVDSRTFEKAGRTEVTVTYEGKTDSFEVTVNEKKEPDLSVKAGDVISFGPYEWRVLVTDGSKALLITEEAVAERYHQTESWGESRLREWLNGKFMEGFTAEEQNRILTVSIPFLQETDHDEVYGNPPTKDRVFLLSREEAETYFTDDADRRCTMIGLTAYCSWLLRSARGLGVRSEGTVDRLVTSGGVRPAVWINLGS